MGSRSDPVADPRWDTVAGTAGSREHGRAWFGSRRGPCAVRRDVHVLTRGSVAREDLAVSSPDRACRLPRPIASRPVHQPVSAKGGARPRV